MPRVTFHQFRAALVGRSEPDTLVRAYREVARRPELAAKLRAGDWIVWTQAANDTSAHLTAHP
jgi:hypothetical protein